MSTPTQAERIATIEANIENIKTNHLAHIEADMRELREDHKELNKSIRNGTGAVTLTLLAGFISVIVAMIVQ